MSVAQAQEAVSSLEFTGWIAFYLVEAEIAGAIEPEPDPDELGDKLAVWAAMHNAKLRGVNAIAGESAPRRDDGAPRRGVRA